MSQPVYAPPPGSPPPHFQPPPGSPPPAQTSQVLPTQPPVDTDTSDIAPPSSDPPPAYTRRAADPPPTWSSIDFTDLTDSENPSDLATRLPLDPPPSCFSTPSPPRIRTRSFEPFRIPSRDQSLSGGFRLLYPRGLLTPHGITQEDWTRFLQDLGVAARLSARGLSVRGDVQPQAPRAGFLRGRTGTAYDASFGKTPVEEVQGLIQVWNESALERRKVRVTLRPVNDVQARRREAYELFVEAL